jgi:serine/threonine protein kinase
MSKINLALSTTVPAAPPYAAKRPAALPQGTQIGGYTIVRQLSVGGFGVVYLAKAKNDALVAIKEYLPSSLVKRSVGEFEPTVAQDKLPLYRLGLKSFFEEGRALAQLSHPSVVGVQNFFRANETIYMVMNYLQGATLQDFIITARNLKKQKIFRESTIRSLFDEILHGLRIVHQSKMLHLDIKPANLFITNNNKAVLIDFGAARQVIQNDSAYATRPMYTPGFAAPEMYERQGLLGPWSDIYAIGACIFASMQGYPPVDATSRQSKDKLTLILGRLRGIYSDNLIELVEWCMAIEPQSRPQSVLAVQKQLADTDNLRYQELGLAHRVKSGIGKLFS